MQTTATPEEIFTVEECTSHLCIARSRVFALLADDEILSFVIGSKSRRIRKADVDAFVEKLAQVAREGGR